MVKRIVLAALAGVLLSPTAAVAQEVDWSRLPYLVDTQPKLILGTDATWSGAKVVNVGRFMPADATFGLTRSFTRRYIWGSSCGRSVERRRFTKTILVPGRPSAGTFNLGYGPARGGQPFESASMLVNGETVVRLPRGYGRAARRFPGYRAGNLPRRVLDAFRHGANTVEIRATKAELGRGERCNDRRLPRYVGVLGDLSLDFHGDVKITPPQLPAEVVHNVTNGQAIPIQGTIRITNAGPSTALRGDIQLSIGGDGSSALVQLPLPGAPLHACAYVPHTPGILNCEYRELRAGESASISFLGGTQANTGFFSGGAGEMTVEVTAYPRGALAFEPFPADNRQVKRMVLCQAGATAPACK
jgi:hypothetical protein